MVEDPSPNFNCFHQASEDFDHLFRFQGKETELQNLTLTNYFERNDDHGSYQTTLKMWIYREHLSSTKGEVKVLSNGTISGRSENPNEPGSWDEVLFEHDGIMKLAFWKNASDYLTMYNFNDTQNRIHVKIPRG
jgi:hypothetical protein